MAKFDFWKEHWLLDNPDWVLKRESDWSVFEQKLHIHHNKNEVSAFKTYFLKGEWTPEAKCEPSIIFKIFNVPNLTKDKLELILSFITDKKELIRVRLDLFTGCFINIAPIILDTNGNNIKWLIEYLTFYEPTYSHNVVNYRNFKGITKFPYPINPTDDLNGFYWSFVKIANKWLETKAVNPNCGIQYIINHWFTSEKYLKSTAISNEFSTVQLYNLFLQIHNFIPSHYSNIGMQEKQSFVNQFNECVAKYGFHNEAIQQLWDKAGVDKEDAWVDKVMLNPISEDKINKQNSYEKELFRTFVSHEVPSYKVDFKKIAQVFKKYDFTNDEFTEGMVQRVKLTEHLTSKFKSELGYSDTESIYGLRYQFSVNSKYLGTDKSLLKLDLISVNKFKQEINPTFMIIERPRERNALCKSRVCLKNRQFIIDAIRAELGIQFSRYLGFTYDESNPRKIPPEPKYYDSYLEEMAEPFIDANYFPLRIGRFGLLDNEDDDFPLK